MSVLIGYKQIKKNIPIVKFFEKRLFEIPEDIRQEFMDTIWGYSDRDYDLTDNKFPYDSFGEDAIKALYLWKPESGEKFKTFRKFFKAITNTVHDKNTILSMANHQEEDVSGESFADFYSKAVREGS